MFRHLDIEEEEEKEEEGREGVRELKPKLGRGSSLKDVRSVRRRLWGHIYRFEGDPVQQNHLNEEPCVN